MKINVSTPAEQGIPAGAILSMLDQFEKDGSHVHEMIILRHDHIVAEGYWKPFKAEDLHIMYSASKSFTSTAVGFAVSEDLLTVQDKVYSFFPEIPESELSENTKKMTVWNLLTMSTGHTVEPTESVFATEDWVNTFLHMPPQAEPGSLYLYNTAATYMLSAIVQKLTGQRIFDYLKPRFFEPLGLGDSGMFWDNDPKGICQGGIGMHCTARDLLIFGLCYLKKGMGIIPEAWVEEATSKQIATSVMNDPDWTQGYGYQIWRNIIPNSFRADGAFGQFSIILPDQDMVVVVNSGTATTQKVLDAVTEMVRKVDTVSPDEANDQSVLEKRLGSLSVSVSSVREHVNPEGHFMNTDPLWGIHSASIDREQVRLFTENGYAGIPMDGNWHLVTLPGFCPQERADKLLPIAQPWHSQPFQLYGSVGWLDAQTMRICLIAVGWPFRYRLDYCFADDDIKMKVSCSVGLEPEAEKETRVYQKGCCIC